MTKQEVWKWIKANDPVLTKFLLDAPKGFIKNVRLEMIDGNITNESNGRRTGSR